MVIYQKIIIQNIYHMLPAQNQISVDQIGVASQ